MIQASKEKLKHAVWSQRCIVSVGQEARASFAKRIRIISPNHEIVKWERVGEEYGQSESMD